MLNSAKMLVLLCALVVPLHAQAQKPMSTITVSTASELSAALRSAQAGDEILLESGDYGNFDFNGHNYSDYVTIRSADGNQGATFDGVTFTNSSHIRIDGVHVDSPSNGSSSSAIVRFEASSNNIQFMNSEVNAPIDDEYWGHYAFHVKGADNIRIEGNDVHNVKDGVWAVSASNVEIVGNEFDMLGRDTIKFASINGLLIEDNVGPRSVFAQPGAHIDFIQGQGSSSNITIRGNLLLPENGYSSQGIFLGDAVYNNVLIEQNILYNTLVRAISVNDGTNIVAQNNTVLTVPGQGHKQASIILPSGSTSRDNIVGSYQGGPNGSNFYAEWDDPSSAYYYDKLFVNASTGQGVTLEDLRPVEGGPADNPNLGAYLRLMELLDGAEASGDDPAPAPDPVDDDPAPTSDPIDDDPAPAPDPIDDDPAPTPDPIDDDPAPTPDPDSGAVPNPVFMTAGSGAPEVIDHDPSMMLDEGTLELVFSADALSVRQGIFSKDAYGYGNGGHLTILLENGDLLVRLQSSAATHSIRIENVVTAGPENHMALTFGPGGMQLYLGGVLVGSNAYTGGLAGNAEPIVLGGNQWGSGDGVADKIQHEFSGTVSTVNIYDEALDAGQVAYLTAYGPGPVEDPSEDPNTAPEGIDDTVETAYGTPVTVDVLANDSDAEDDALAVLSIGTPANGTVMLNDDGTLTYTPDAGFAGVDSFTYEVSDGTLSSTATLSVAVEAAPEPQPPAGDIVVSSAAELMVALESAQGGDTILLAEGDYGAVALNGLGFASDVTLLSETPQGAVFDSLEIRDSAHLVIDGVHVDHPTDGGRGAALVDITGSSEHITFVNSEVNGSLDSSFDGAYGIRVHTGTSFIDVSDNYVHNVRHGAVFFGTTDLTVSGNNVEYVGEDSFKFGGVTRALIENNDGASIYKSVNLDVHHDFMQFQGDATDTIIRGNTFMLTESDNNKVVQGIFLKDGVFESVLIEDNLVYTNTVNAIFVRSDAGTGGDITIRENTVLATPDKTIWGNADIRIVDLEGDYLVENNIVDRVVDSVGTGTVRNNLSLQWENPNAANHYNSVYVNATGGSTATIEDFQPVTDGPGAYGSGMGAEERIAEILEVGVTPPVDDPVDPPVDDPVTPPADDPVDPPEQEADLVATDDYASVDMGASIILDVLANDVSPDGGDLRIKSVETTENGLIATNGKIIVFTPDAGFYGTVSFDYVLSDGGAMDVATVEIDVVPPLPTPSLEVMGTTSFSGINADVLTMAPEEMRMSEGTIAFSFSTDDANDRQGLFSVDAKQFDGTGDHISIWIGNGEVRARFQDGENSIILKGGPIETGQEYDLWATFGADGAALYIDTILMDETDAVATDMSDNPEYLQLGALGWSSDTGDIARRDALDGTMSDVQVFDEILIQDQLLLV